MVGLGLVAGMDRTDLRGALSIELKTRHGQLVAQRMIHGKLRYCGADVLRAARSRAWQMP
jgi:hypothetical protein